MIFRCQSVCILAASFSASSNCASMPLATSTIVVLLLLRVDPPAAIQPPTPSQAPAALAGRGVQRPCRGRMRSAILANQPIVHDLDGPLAATAMARGLTLVARNVRDVERTGGRWRD